MKKKLLYICSVALSLFVSSCEKTVEVEPKNQISPNVALNTIGGYESLLNSAYVRMIDFGYWGRNMAILGDVMADNIYTELSYANGRFTANNINQLNSHFSIWTVAYAEINDANTIIATIDANITDQASTARRGTLKAEALALRANAYFDLARIYGFEPTSLAAAGGFDKSVPLRLTPTTGLPNAEQIQRSSVAEVYKSIETDLIASIALFPADPAASRTRMNKGAAYALLGKAYLYEGKWAEAITAFDAAMDPANTAARLATAGNYVSAFKAGPNTESFFEIVINPVTQLGGVTGSNESLYSYTHPNSYNGLATFGGQTASDELYSLFETGDDRFKMFFKYGGNSTNPPLFNWVDKYSGARGNYTDNPKIIRFADVLLMKAEALAEQGNFAAAAALVVQLRTNRNATVVGVPVTAAIKDYIQVERRRELFFEGHRWFDLKRKGLGITKPAKTGVQTVEAKDPRVLAPIPLSEVTLGLTQNPGY
jgi:tetratricopeptide (TPR) repeat protein